MCVDIWKISDILDAYIVGNLRSNQVEVIYYYGGRAAQRVCCAACCASNLPCTHHYCLYLVYCVWYVARLIPCTEERARIDLNVNSKYACTIIGISGR
jgi:hypothetical protein